MPRQIPTARAETIHLATISTPREQLLAVPEGPVDEAILQQAEKRNYRQVVVIRPDGDVAGLVPTQKLRRLFEAGEPIQFDKAQIRIPELPGKVTLLELLDGLAQYGAVIHRAETGDQRDSTWFALISNADLNRPVFRASLYMVIATLETSLGELIMDEFGDDWGAIRLLSEHTESRVRDYYDEAKREGVDLSPIVYITLSDMFTIVQRSRNVWQMLDFPDPKKVDEVAHEINETRNRTMHPIQPLIHRGSDVPALRDTIAHMHDLIDRMQAIAHREPVS